jgi:hypothetical protein
MLNLFEQSLGCGKDFSSRCLLDFSFNFQRMNYIYTRGLVLRSVKLHQKADECGTLYGRQNMFSTEMLSHMFNDISLTTFGEKTGWVSMYRGRVKGLALC